MILFYYDVLKPNFKPAKPKHIWILVSTLTACFEELFSIPARQNPLQRFIRPGQKFTVAVLRGP